MFRLFGKKKETSPAPEREKKAPAPLPCGFEGEELSVLAVTGPGSFVKRQDEQGQPYCALELTAWMEEDAPEIRQGCFELAVPQDEELLEYLREHVPRDFILKFSARRSPSGDRLLLTSLPVPGFDPDLKAILDAQKAPALFTVEGLGELALNRSTGWIQGEAAWGEGTVQLLLEPAGQEELDAAGRAACRILADVPAWDEKVRTFAAEQLDGQYDREEQLDGMSQQELHDRLECESLQVWPDGRFEIWLHDADYAWQASVRLTGSVSAGTEEVYLEG